MAGYGAYQAGKRWRDGSKSSTNIGQEASEQTNINNVKVNKGQQDKHIIGTNNYKNSIENGIKRSILKDNPEELLSHFAGTGQKIGMNKERVDFGKIIGQYYDKSLDKYVDTTRGIIHYDGKGGAHIVPSAPIGY